MVGVREDSDLVVRLRGPVSEYALEDFATCINHFTSSQKMIRPSLSININKFNFGVRG